MCIDVNSRHYSDRWPCESISSTFARYKRSLNLTTRKRLILQRLKFAHFVFFIQHHFQRNSDIQTKKLLLNVTTKNEVHSSPRARTTLHILSLFVHYSGLSLSRSKQMVEESRIKEKCPFRNRLLILLLLLVRTRSRIRIKTDTKVSSIVWTN